MIPVFFIYVSYRKPCHHYSFRFKHFCNASFLNASHRKNCRISLPLTPFLLIFPISFPPIPFLFIPNLIFSSILLPLSFFHPFFLYEPPLPSPQSLPYPSSTIFPFFSSYQYTYIFSPVSLLI